MEIFGNFILGVAIGLFTGFVAAVKMLMSMKENQEEAEIGNVARDQDGELWLYFDEPTKRKDIGVWKANGNCAKVYPERFSSVRWEDEEPTKVKIIKSVEVR